MDRLKELERLLDQGVKAADEAVAEIERLTKENAELRAAVEDWQTFSADAAGAASRAEDLSRQLAEAAANGSHLLHQLEQQRQELAEARAEAARMVERAFRDGVQYGTICEVTDIDEAWRTSAARAALDGSGDGAKPVNETCKCDPFFHEYYSDGVKHCRSCDAEWHPAAAPATAGGGEKEADAG